MGITSLILISILLHTLNSTLYFVSSRTEDDRRTVETFFLILKVSLIFLKSLHAVCFYPDLLPKENKVIAV